MLYKSALLNYLEERGYLYQLSNKDLLDNTLDKEKVKVYIGFDCTANSLHVGSLLQIMLLRILQKFGHTPVVLLGGATSLIGDPSGKTESRQMLTKEDIELNKKGIDAVISKFISKENVLFVDNADWLNNLNYIDLLRDYGRYFTVNRMLTFDSVSLRLEREQPLTFLEFNYMILQAIDFYFLNKNHGVSLQMGGSDQWGNIINGIELVRKISQKEVFGVTSPLITNSSGQKMGKTASGAVWLSEDKISTWDYYQFWRNTADSDTIKFLKLFTDLPIEEINELSKLEGQAINEAKKILAFEATKMCFSESVALKNQQIAIETFEKNDTPLDLPSFFIEESVLDNKTPLIDIMIKFNLSTSKSEARKLIQNGGVKVNDTAVADTSHALAKKDLKEGIIKISLGKKKHFLLKLI